MIFLNMLDHYFYMQLALDEAKKAQSLGEVPVGSVLVMDDEIMTTAHNTPITQNDPSGHAEINVLRQAGAVLQNYRLLNSTLYVTLEPCVMCFGAMVHARVSHLVFGASDKKTGVCGGCVDLSNQSCFNHKIKVVSGIMQTECSQILSDFFKQKRKKQ